jgi:hypothetical protein
MSGAICVEQSAPSRPAGPPKDDAALAEQQQFARLASATNTRLTEVCLWSSLAARRAEWTGSCAGRPPACRAS